MRGQAGLVVGYAIRIAANNRDAVDARWADFRATWTVGAWIRWRDTEWGPSPAPMPGALHGAAIFNRPGDAVAAARSIHARDVVLEIVAISAVAITTVDENGG